MFEIIVKKRFTAGHGLLLYKGNKEEIHDHDWLVEICLGAETLDRSGCVADFVEVDELLEKTIFLLDGKNLNELNLFSEKSPSAENLAEYIFNKTVNYFKNKRAKVVSVTVWEDPDHGATIKR